MARDTPAAIAADLADVGRRFYARGWVLGTSGNFSVVQSRDPLRLAITASSVHKGHLRPDDILRCDDKGAIVSGRVGAQGRRTLSRARRASSAARPSAETLLHI